MSNAEPTITVAQGALRGHRVTGAWGHQFYAFKGIPYAKPPVGELRFQPPQPAESWTGVKDATKYGNRAPQSSMFTNEFEGDEDCLFINVFTPKLPSEGLAAPLPVMFMVHGGGLAVLSGEFFGPDYLMQHDVIMISFNYRLGPLGFLSTGDSVVPGNMGLKDQVMALRWVKDNIAKFGGDPKNVTVLGMSAGGWSTHALMLSPLAKGLFHRGIAMSGVAIGEGVCSRLIPERSFLLAEQLGLQKRGSQELLDFMKRQSAKDIIEKTMLGRTKEDVERSVLFPFVATVEPASEGAFFPRHPLDILKSGDFQPLPFIASVAKFEGIIYAMNYSKDPQFVSCIAVNPGLLVPEDILCTDEEKKQLGQQIKQFYFGEKPINSDNIKELFTVLGDTMFSYAAVRAAKLHAALEPPVYFYIPDFVVPAAASQLWKVPPALEDCTDAPHGAEMPYVFHSFATNETLEPDSEKGKICVKVTRILTNFAKNGQPTPAGDPLLEGLSWPGYSARDGHYLRLHDGGLEVQQRPFRDAVLFWDQLYDSLGS